MADWAGLPEDLILSIVEKIKLVEDRAVFQSVCKSWNEVSKNNKCKLHRQIPWLLMPRETDDDTDQQFYSLLSNRLYMREMSYAECIPLNHGWVLSLLDKGAVEGARVNLVHPISRARIELPPLTTWRRCREQQFICEIRAAAMSADPSESSDFVVMIVHGMTDSNVSYWKPRERRWTSMSERVVGYSDLTYYHDQFYSIDYDGKVWSFTFDNNSILTRRLVAEIDYRFRMYVVGSLGRLLVMGREHCRNRSRKYAWSVKFHVYELDLKKGSYEPITSLGDSAIFVGRHTSMSVDHASEYQDLRSNHIYFSDRAVGCYSLEDDDDVELRWVRHGSRCSFWFIPSLPSTSVCKFIKRSSLPKKINYLKFDDVEIRRVRQGGRSSFWFIPPSLQST